MGFLIELFGYLGSTLVVVSMLMSSVVKLRVINTIGSIISGTYAFIIGSFPLAFMNICLIIINIYNLMKLLKKEQSYSLIDATCNDGLLHYILTYYKEDIHKYFPGFTGETTLLDQAYIVCCNGNPAGVLLGKKNGYGTIDVVLDYSVPAYRDCSVGTYLYSKLPAKGISTLTYAEKESETHKDYLVKMGFVKDKDMFVKKLK